MPHGLQNAFRIAFFWILIHEEGSNNRKDGCVLFKTKQSCIVFYIIKPKQVKQVFSISRVGAIAGCYVAQGTVERNCRVRVNREGRTIGDYGLDSLKREKDDAKEVSRGMECGIKLAGFNDIKIGDILEAYKIEEVARTL